MAKSESQSESWSKSESESDRQSQAESGRVRQSQAESGRVGIGKRGQNNLKFVSLIIIITASLYTMLVIPSYA